MKITWHKNFGVNKGGTDYFVGDIHGHYDELMSALSLVNFNTRKDRLFCVGDLINRGPKSIEVISLLKNKWMNSAIGNHEIMIVESAANPARIIETFKFGGLWLKDISNSKLTKMAKTIVDKMCLSMSVSTKNGVIGIVHASSPKNWEYMQIDPPDEDIAKTLLEYCTWDFDQGSKSGHECPVMNVDAVVSGHISSKENIVSKNHVWIDTLHSTKKISVYSAEEIFGMIK